MKIGRTIGAERDRVESESERALYHEKIKRRKMVSVAIYLAILMIIGLGIASIIVGLRNKKAALPERGGAAEVEPTIQIIDEAGIAVSRKVKEFVGFLEQDLKAEGITLSRAVLPRNKTREVDVYVLDFEGYFKLSLDRGAGVSAEDLARMLRYLRGQGFSGVEYVDLRVAGKGFYRGAVSAEPSTEVEQGSEEGTAEDSDSNSEDDYGEDTGLTPEDYGEDSSSVFVREGELNEGTEYVEVGDGLEGEGE